MKPQYLLSMILLLLLTIPTVAQDTTSTVCATAYQDLNQNESLDPGEPPLAGVTITLLAGYNDPIAEHTTTGDETPFCIPDLSPDTYFITFETADTFPLPYRFAVEAGQTITLEFPGRAELPTLALSDEQQILVDEFGYPDVFTLIEMDNANEEPLRYESWTYFSGNITYIFLDGVYQRDEYEPYPGSGILESPYRPEQFVLGEPLATIQTMFPDLEWEQFTNDYYTAFGLDFVISDRLLLGYENDALIYVETLAIQEEGGGQ